MPLVLPLVLVLIGLGVPARGALVRGVRAQPAGVSVPAGVAYRAANSLILPVTVVISPNPTAVSVLTTIAVTTAPNVACSLAIRFPDRSVQTVSSGAADNSGQLSFQFSPPFNSVGQDQAIVICSNPLSAATGTGTATFSVLPPAITPTATPVVTAPGAEQVAIAPNQPLVPGSVFSIVGGGFAPGATITFTGFILYKTYSAVVQANGTFVIPNIMVPYTQQPGTINSVLRNSANPFDHVVVPVVVMPLAPAIVLDTTAAAHGDTVGVSGSGFGGNEVVDGSIGPVPVFTVKADNIGDFSATFTLPSSIPIGIFNVAARGESTGALGVASLTVQLVSPFAPTSTPTASATPVPPSSTPGPPTFTPTITPVPLGPPQAVFYLAEGTTAGATQVTYTILNTAATPANTTIELVFSDGRVSSASFVVPAQSLYQVNANQLVGVAELGQPFSARITADQPVSVSRSIVRPGQDGTLSNGTMAIYHYFYFAEGYTARGFQEQLALFNSVNANANVELRLLPSSGAAPIIRRYIVGPLRRYTINVNDLAPRQSVGALVISDVELSVERTLTFGKNGHGQTTVAGVDAPASTWYFAEGSTKNGFSEFITLLNPASTAVTVTINFYDPRGRRIGAKTLVLPSRARATVNVGTVVRATSVGAIVTGSGPILAERTMYRGALTSATVIGSGSFGRSTLAPAYEFPSGDTSAGDAEFLLLLNPSTAPLAIQARFYTTSGAMVPYTTIVPAHSRITLNVARDVPGLPPGPNGVLLTSVNGSTPFMAEQSEYLHNYGSADSSIGVARGSAPQATPTPTA
ncbi:MAG TPA: hypothetical protein VHB98_10350 [Chloroflexota bacterium]|nr:hypothetical protein [Chloroflexota bacterium]